MSVKFISPTLEYIENRELLGLEDDEPMPEILVATTKQEEPTIKGLDLVEGQKIIHDNQSGISYDMLFGAYLIGAKEIVLTDPFIRLPYQIRNLMEFAKLISTKKDKLEEVKFHLITYNNEDYIQTSKEAFTKFSESLESMGFIFTYEFDENIHDRSIVLDNGWKIVLGRGLDVYQKTDGAYDIAEIHQEMRLCKGCEITYVKV